MNSLKIFTDFWILRKREYIFILVVVVVVVFVVVEIERREISSLNRNSHSVMRAKRCKNKNTERLDNWYPYNNNN